MNSGKTILYVRTDIYNQKLIAGGSVTHTLGVIKGFKELGYCVVAATSTMHEQIGESVDQLIPLSNPRFFSFLRWKLNCLLSNIFFTMCILKMTRNVNITYIYQRYGILNCVGVLLSRIKKIPLILEYNGSEYWVFNNWAARKGLNLKWIVKWIESFNIHQSTYIVAVSQVLKEELIERGADPKKIIMVPNGVDTELYNPACLVNERNEIRKKYNICKDASVVGFIGTFSQWHGIELMADIIPLLIKDRNDIYFLLIGDGVLKNWFVRELEKKVGKTNRIIFTGLIPAHDARNYLAACDIFICPTQANKDGTRFFGSPTKMFEYLSMGKPIIASAIEQNKDIIMPALKLDHSNDEIASDESCGVLVKSDSTEEFISAIIKLLDAKQGTKELMGFNARRRAIEHFTWGKHVLMIERFIEESHGQ